MKKFTTTVYSEPYGETQLTISVHEKKQTGVFEYRNEVYTISQCCKSKTGGELIFILHIGQYIKLKSALLTTVVDSNPLLIFLAGSTPHRYIIADDVSIRYRDFVADLKLPVAAQTVDVGRSQEEEQSEWPNMFAAPLAKVSLSVFLAWKPGGEDVANFIALSVNNTMIDLSGTYPYGTTAYMVPVGSYDTGKEHLISWSCRAGIPPIDPVVGIGYFKGNDLSTRKILKLKTVDYFEEWSDSAKIKL